MVQIENGKTAIRTNDVVRRYCSCRATPALTSWCPEPLTGVMPSSSARRSGNTARDASFSLPRTDPGIRGNCATRTGQQRTWKETQGHTDTLRQVPIQKPLAAREPKPKREPRGIQERTLRRRLQASCALYLLVLPLMNRLLVRGIFQPAHTCHPPDCLVQALMRVNTQTGEGHGERSPLLDGVVGVPEVEFAQAVLPHVQQVGQPQLPICSRLRPQPGPPQPATSEERHQPTATRVAGDTLGTAQPAETSLQQACLAWSVFTRRWHRTALLKDNTLS